jgi:hypothetical protein
VSREEIIMLRFVLALAALLVATAVSAQAYRWVDKDGKVHYSDSPPPAAAKNVEQKKLQGSVVESGEVPYETQQAARNFPVTVYTTKDCKDLCKTVTDALNRRGVPYRMRPSQTHRTAQRIISRFHPGFFSRPC